jgi:hypothetical protein
MSLLEALGLPRSEALVEADSSRPQSKVTLVNGTGSDLRLLQAKLAFKTARFVPAVPVLVPAHGETTFQVVEDAVGAARTNGFARYHLDQRRHEVDVTFRWTDGRGDVDIEGKGPFTQFVQTSSDSVKGNTYKLVLSVSGAAEPDKLQLRVGVINNSGFDMTLVSATLDDPEHTEFADKPRSQKDKGSHSFFVQPLDDEHPEGAGRVVYRVERPDKPHLVRMRWRKGGKPVGTVDPNDGEFSVVAEGAGNRFSFEVLPHVGPAPAAGRTKVTVFNQTVFTMTRSLLQLEGKKAQFKSQPADTIEGGRKTVFEVESADPEFPETDGTVAYAFKSNPSEPDHVVTAAWRSDSDSTARIEPPADGVTVDVLGNRTDDVLFNVLGPDLDFNPPEKIKQPTLRRGDKSSDGWVEYLQEALNHHLNAGLVVDGDFGGKTHDAVIAFQKSHKDEGVLVDGIVGNETWSFLREGVPEKPGTDGRKPHSFVEKGNEARWVREKAVVRFDAGQDALVMQAVSVGNIDEIQGRPVRIRIVNPLLVTKVLERPIGPGVPESTTGQGSSHEVKVERFATLFDDTATQGPPPGEYTIDAFFDAELGGDKFSEVLVIPVR